MMSQLATPGIVFDVKVKSIGRSEQMERLKGENTGIGLTVTVMTLLVSVQALVPSVLVTITR